MDVMKLLLIAVGIMLLTVIIGFSLPAHDVPFSSPHPEFPSLQKSTGVHIKRLDVVGLGLAFGLAVILWMCMTVIQAMKKKGSIGVEWRWIIKAFIVYALIFGGMIQSYLYAPIDSYFGGFPAASAWFLYPFYLFPFIFVIFYVIRFDHWTFRKEDEEQFRSLVNKNKQNT